MTTSSKRRIDLRVIAGIVLVIVSVIGVTFVLSQGKATQSVYVAAQPIATGRAISADDLIVVQVALGEATETYLTEGQLAKGSVAQRAIGAGEFIPATAITQKPKNKATSVVLELATPMPEAVIAGSRVDLWSAMAAGQGVYATPTVLVEGAEIIGEVKQEGLTAFQEGAMVEVLIPHDAVAAVLEAQANNDAMSVVPSVPHAKVSK